MFFLAKIYIFARKNKLSFKKAFKKKKKGTAKKKKRWFFDDNQSLSVGRLLFKSSCNLGIISHLLQSYLHFFTSILLVMRYCHVFCGSEWFNSCLEFIWSRWQLYGPFFLTIRTSSIPKSLKTQ